jgi:D-tyrosyl-tRNA(Tyr) deacylase
MRILIQRVSEASVTVEGQVAGSIEQGYVILVGVTHGDSNEKAEWLANKIVGLRLFEDDAGKMNLSIADIGGSVLLVSQFTLYANAGKGRRPSFTAAAHPDHAEPLVELLAHEIKAKGIHVETGIFGAMMSVKIINDGPVTLMIER